jgi:hypothetical protein
VKVRIDTVATDGPEGTTGAGEMGDGDTGASAHPAAINARATTTARIRSVRSVLSRPAIVKNFFAAILCREQNSLRARISSREAAILRIRHHGLFVAAIAAVLSAATLAQSLPAERPLVLLGARVYPAPGDRAIENGAVVIRNGSIVYAGTRDERQLPKDATVVDCTGQIVTAGFWNSHVHFTDARWESAAAMPAAALSDQITQMLVRHGFTTVLDSGSYWPITAAIRRLIEMEALPGPRIFTTGEIVFPAGGALPPSMLKQLGMIVGDMPQVDMPDEASLIARDMLDRGADAIKVYLATWWNDPPVRMAPAVVRAISDVTHRRRKAVLGHPTDLQGIETR